MGSVCGVEEGVWLKVGNGSFSSEDNFLKDGLVAKCLLPASF